MFSGTVRVKVCEATGLRPTDFQKRHNMTFGKPDDQPIDPYVSIDADEHHLDRSNTKPKTFDPVWNETFIHEVHNATKFNASGDYTRGVSRQAGRNSYPDIANNYKNEDQTRRKHETKTVFSRRAALGGRQHFHAERRRPRDPSARLTRRSIARCPASDTEKVLQHLQNVYFMFTQAEWGKQTNESIKYIL